MILDLINQRFLLLQKEIEHRKKNLKLKAYHIKEYEKASAFLNKNNARELESLYRLIGEGGESMSVPKSQNANLSKNDDLSTSKSSDLSKNVSSMSEGKENTLSINKSNDLPKNDTSLMQKQQSQSVKEVKIQETTQQTQQNQTKTQTLQDKMKSSGFVVRR